MDLLSETTFLNRQALYLRPDPSRVVVRPFKPATEPRDLNPTDRTRANHIVDRVLGLDPATAASLLADVLENFQGRHRNLIATFEARAGEMEDAFSAHDVFSATQRQLVGAYFLHEYSFEAAAYLCRGSRRCASATKPASTSQSPECSLPMLSIANDG